MRSGAVALLTLCCTTPVTVVAAQAVQDTLLARLTIEALAANPSLRQAAAARRAADARVPAAGALPDPVLTLGVTNLTLPRFAFRESDFTEVDVELTQELPWPGTLRARTEASRAEARMAGAEREARAREVVVHVAELYHELQYTATALEELQRQQRLLTAAVEVSTARYAATTAPQVDPLQARAALGRLEAEEAALHGRRAAHKAALQALRGRAEDEEIAVPPLDARSAPIAPPDAERAHSALDAHPHLTGRRAAVEAAERTARAEQLLARPDFLLLTRYGARPLGSDFFSAGVGIRLPVWAGRKQRALAAAARTDAEAARARVDEARIELLAEAVRLRAEERRLQTQQRLLHDRIVPASRAAAEASLRGYRAGEVDFATVLTAQDALYRAELDAARVTTDRLVLSVRAAQLHGVESAR